MAVKKGKTRVIVTIPESLKEILDNMSEYDKRNSSQEFEYILEKYINDNTNNYPSYVLRSTKSQD